MAAPIPDKRLIKLILRACHFKLCKAQAGIPLGPLTPSSTQSDPLRPKLGEALPTPFWLSTSLAKQIS